MADGDTLELYERMKDEIAVHASGAFIRNLPDDGEAGSGHWGFASCLFDPQLFKGAL